MAYEQIKIEELVNRAVIHQWSIPEFQRGFVWKSTQVRDLVESLWLDYPIGSLLVWNNNNHIEERVAIDKKHPDQWLVDGQQRTTALCVLFGRKPYWWDKAEDWNKIISRYDIRFDIDAKIPPFFLVANAVIKNTKGSRYIPLNDLLILDIKKEDDQKKLENLARKIKSEGFCVNMDAMEIYTRLDRVRKIRDKEVVTITIEHELEDVVEIFARLNSKGTRVTEADIYLGYVAANNPGFVRDEFLPFSQVLCDAGFDINPNLLFRSITGIGQWKTRFKDIPDKYWASNEIRLDWRYTKIAWSTLIKKFQDFGISTNEILPTEAALVILTSLIHKYKNDMQFNLAMYWLIQASRWGRYSAASTTALDEDLRDIQESNSLIEAIDKLLMRFHNVKFAPEDFLKDYTDGKFGRFLLYLLVYRNRAMDWDQSSNRLGFDGIQLLVNFKPQWHHIFPKKYLDNGKNDDIDALANIAVIGPSINIRINAKSPMTYVEKYKISEEKLSQQFIDYDFVNTTIDEFSNWLCRRAERLASEANSYLDELKGK